MRIKHTIQLAVADDAAMKDPLFGEVDATLAVVQIDGYTGVVSGKIKIDAGEDVDLPFGGVASVCGIYLELDQDCIVTINEGHTITIKRGNTTSGSVAKLFLEATLTAINIEAPAEADAQVTYCAWGDPAE
jgi:hypothetical protein